MTQLQIENVENGAYCAAFEIAKLPDWNGKPTIPEMKAIIETEFLKRLARTSGPQHCTEDTTA